MVDIMGILKDEAGEKISSCLVGSNLDEIKIAGRSVSLRFISDKLTDGYNKFVYVSFSCGAKVIKYGTARIGGNFVEERSEFLSNVFLLYGEEIGSTKLEGDGSLTLSFDGGDIFIFLAVEDFDDDDSVWDVTSEASASTSQEVLRVVSCGVVEGCVTFW